MSKPKNSKSNLFLSQKKSKKTIQAKINESKPKNSKSKGDSGQTQFLLNDVTSEFDTSLMGREGAKKFNEMSKSDGIVGGILSSYNNLLLSCNWGLAELVDANEKEEQIYEVLTKWFFDDNNFETTLNSILRFLPLGFSVFNKYAVPYSYDNDTYMLPVMAERLQQSIYRLDYKENFAEQVTTTGTIEEIPFKDLVFFTFRKEGIDRRGVSLLRQAYYDWVDKKDVKVVAKKGIVREMLGLPIGKVPSTVHADSAEFEDFKTLLDMLSNRDYADTDDSIVMPDNYSLEMFNSAFKISEIKDFLSYYDSSIAISVLCQFILLGQQGKGGSFALGSDQSDFFLDGLKFIIDYICQQFTALVIMPAILSNWGTENIDASKFKLQGLNLNKKASSEFATVLKTLIEGGLIRVSEPDEVLIRKMYGLPELDESAIIEQDKKKDNDLEKDAETTENSINLSLIPITLSWNNAVSREKYIDQEVDKLTKYSKTSLQIISDKLVSSIRYQLKKGTTASQGLKDVKINANSVNSYKKNMGIKLSSIIQTSWDNAQLNSLPELKKLRAATPSDLPTQTLTSFAINQSDLVVEKQINDMRELALLTSNTATTKGYGIEQTIAQVESNLDNYIESGANAELANTTAITQSISYSEMQYYSSIEDDLWGYRFDNNSPKTDICNSLVGKVYRKNSPEMEIVSPPLHFRCKSFFAPIYKTNEKPKYDDYIPSPSILKQKTM